MDSVALASKYENLKNYLKSLGSVAVAFSSGVDSTFLLKVAHDVLGDKAIAITASSHSFPRRELDEAVAFCKKEGIHQVVFESDELSIPGFRENPKNRCYICKKSIFENIVRIAAENGIANVCEGSNMDDNGDYRPGLTAIAELGIKSPLRHSELYKAEIRSLSKDLELPTWTKPSFACLATRFVYGETITAEKLKMVEQAENFLLDMGFLQERVRVHGGGCQNVAAVNGSLEAGKQAADVNDGPEVRKNIPDVNSGLVARIEVLPEQLQLVIENREKIAAEFKSIGFSYVSLDLQGYRTGSMNETLGRK